MPDDDDAILPSASNSTGIVNSRAADSACSPVPEQQVVPTVDQNNAEGNRDTDADSRRDSAASSPRPQAGEASGYSRPESMQYEEPTKNQGRGRRVSRNSGKPHGECHERCIGAWERVKRPGPRGMQEFWEIDSIWATWLLYVTL